MLAYIFKKTNVEHNTNDVPKLSFFLKKLKNIQVYTSSTKNKSVVIYSFMHENQTQSQV